MIDRVTLKSIAIICMAADHASLLFANHDSELFSLMQAAGNFTAMTMCFLLAEGYEQTGSPLRYASRLLFSALLSIIPFQMVIGYGINVMFTLLIALISLVLFDCSRMLGVLFLIIYAPFAAEFDWGPEIPAAALLFHISENREERFYASLLMIAYHIAIPAALENTIPSIAEVSYTSISMLLPALFISFIYSGMRGRDGGTAGRLFFYFFYPAHLLLLFLIWRILC